MLKKIIPFISLSLLSLSVLATMPAIETTPYHQQQTATITSSATAASQSAKTITDKYIVIFSADTLDSAIDNTVQQIHQSHGGKDKPLYRFSLLKGFSGKIPPGQLKKLQADSQVKTIEANQIIELTALAGSRDCR